MRKLKYHVATTLDGFIANPDGSFDGFIGEGDHVSDYLESLKSYSVVVMGRKTYEVGLKEGITNPYPHLKTLVFSRTIQTSPDEHVEIVAENAPAAIRSLKGQDGGDIYLCGGAALATEMFQEALIDEVILKVNPLLLGAGIPVVSALGRRVDLELASSKTYDSGVMRLSYRVRQ